jgi:hypothetical protein
MWIGLMGLAFPTGAAAQGPAGIAAAAGAVPPVAAPVAAAEPTTLWSFLGLSKKQKEQCRQKLCQSPCGQFLNKAFLPMSAFTGGIVPPLCNGLPTPEELADKGAVGTAAAIKAEEAQAKARKAAMKYLGTVDCSRFPDAQDALIKGLRGDTNECVRYEAALALGNGCCCTKATMEALSVAAACSDRDGFHRERSDRVRAAAVAALQRCLACYVDPNPPKQEKPVEGKPEEEKKKDETKSESLTKPQNTADAKSVDTEPTPTAKAKAPRPIGMDYYARIMNAPRDQIVEEARRVVEKYNQVAVNQAVMSRQNSVVGIINSSLADSPIVSATVMENGVPVPRADVVSARPQNLWELVSRGNGPAPTATRIDGPALKSTAEPPAAVIVTEPAPLSPKLDPAPMMPLSPMPTKTDALTKADPVVPQMPDQAPKIASALPSPRPVKPLTPADITGAMNAGDARPKTPAELAGMPRGASTASGAGTGMNVIVNPPKDLPRLNDRPSAKLPDATAAQPALPTLNSPRAFNPPAPKAPAIEPTKPIAATPALPAPTPPAMERPQVAAAPTLPTPVPPSDVAMPALSKPVEPGRTVVSAKPVEPIPAPAASPTPLAARAITVMTEPHPAVVREQIATSLTPADLQSAPELLPVLVEAARSGSDEATRKSAIRALTRCQANSAPVISLLESLTNDPTPAVRVEAAIGLARLRVMK